MPGPETNDVERQHRLDSGPGKRNNRCSESVFEIPAAAGNAPVLRGTARTIPRTWRTATGRRQGFLEGIGRRKLRTSGSSEGESPPALPPAPSGQRQRMVSDNVRRFPPHLPC